MFLSRIDKSKQGTFIALCYKAIVCNDDIDVNELQKLDLYINELELDITAEDVRNISINTIIEELDVLDIVEKKIILCEVLGILISDGTYDAAEKKFYREVAEKIHIPAEMAEAIEKGVFEYTNAYDEFCDLILN